MQYLTIMVINEWLFKEKLTHLQLTNHFLQYFSLQEVKFSCIA